MDFGGEFNLNQLPMIGMLANDPSVDAKRGGMHGMSNAYQSYRPEVAQARMKALNNQMSMWAPVNKALGSMYGPSAQFDMTQATQSPLTERMMGIGANKDVTGQIDHDKRFAERDEYLRNQEQQLLEAQRQRIASENGKKYAGQVSMSQDMGKSKGNSYNPGSQR